MQKLISTIILLLSLLSVSLGQNSGYLGKHVLLRTDFKVMPSIFVKSSEVSYPSFNDIVVFPFFGIEYIKNDWNTYGLSVSWYKSMFAFYGASILMKEWNGSSYNWNYHGLYSQITGDISAFSIILNRKHYFLIQHMAPIGPYFKPEIFFIRSKVSFDSNQVVSFSTSEPFLPWIPDKWKKQHLTDFGIGFSLGLQRVFLQRVLFNIEFQADLTFAYFYYTLKSSSENYIRNQVGESIFLQNLFVFQVGTGLLID